MNTTGNEHNSREYFHIQKKLNQRREGGWAAILKADTIIDFGLIKILEYTSRRVYFKMYSENVLKENTG